MVNKKNQRILMLALLVGLPSCNSIGISNPFGSGSQEQSRTPQNSTAYLCDGNAQFYVRMQNNGNEAWLIYPTHEVSLTKSSDSNNRFISGAITLVINGDDTTLNDGEKIAYVGCKPQTKK
jgi:membrane-bound inhibitor of C-type lysozyme